MTQPQRQTLLATITVLSLAAGVYWSWNAHGQSRRRLAVVLADTATCREVASAINLQRQGPNPLVQQGGEDPFNVRTYQAAESSGLPKSVIRAVRPQPPQRIANSPYEQRGIELTLEGLTLEQLVRFLHKLQSDDPQMQLASLSLHDPKGWGNDTLWSVQRLVLRHRIYAPATPAAEKANP